MEYNIINEDSKKYIQKLIKEKIIVNHIITDPPYNISKENNFYTLKNRQGVDFGEWDKGFDVCDWIKDYVKILDANGSIIIFCSYLYLSFIVQELNQNGMVVKDIIHWQKTNPMPRNVDRRYVSDVEYAIWAVKKGAKWVFHKDGAYNRSIIQCAITSKNQRYGHPTAKPVELLEKIILTHTNENDLILDPFMGVGSTGVAALKNNRKFLGIEINKEYFDIVEKRLQSL